MLFYVFGWLHLKNRIRRTPKFYHLDRRKSHRKHRFGFVRYGKQRIVVIKLVMPR